MAEPNRVLKGGMVSFSSTPSAPPLMPSNEAPVRSHYGTKTYPPTYFSNTRASLSNEAEAPESPSFDLTSKITDFEPSIDTSAPPPAKKIKLAFSSVPITQEDPHETPAMRQKTRPKRPTLNLISSANTAEHDSEDEDYLAPRAPTPTTQVPKRSQPPQASNLASLGTPNLDGAYRYPNNAYAELSLSAWPSSSSFNPTIDLNDFDLDGAPMDASTRRHVDERSDVFNPLLLTTSFKAPLPVSDKRTIGEDTHAGDTNLVDLTNDESESKEGPKSITISVPEYDAYLAMCDEEEFLDGLNFPNSVAITGLGDWKSILERKIQREEVTSLESDAVALALWDDAKWTEGTWINCDLRQYDLSKLGKFDAILVDPPWRVRSSEDSQRTIQGYNAKNHYNTMSNEELLSMDVGSLSDRGFIFLWAISSQLQTAFECLTRWGYNYVDRITWVKKTARDRVFIGQGYYLLHSTEMCLVGVKKDVEGRGLESVQKVSNDVIFARTQKRWQKPEAVYEVIERMLPGARKVELFARNHNIRKGWLSLGNQLGAHYNWAHDAITCDLCALQIPIAKTRFKHRFISNLDYCHACFTSQNAKDPVLHAKHNFYVLENNFDEQVFHANFTCASCGVSPLWGIRFSCASCQHLNLCETCHDSRFEGTTRAESRDQKEVRDQRSERPDPRSERLDPRSERDIDPKRISTHPLFLPHSKAPISSTPLISSSTNYPSSLYQGSPSSGHTTTGSINSSAVGISHQPGTGSISTNSDSISAVGGSTLSSSFGSNPHHHHHASHGPHSLQSPHGHGGSAHAGSPAFGTPASGGTSTNSSSSSGGSTRSINRGSPSTVSSLGMGSPLGGGTSSSSHSSGGGGLSLMSTGGASSSVASRLSSAFPSHHRDHLFQAIETPLETGCASSGGANTNNPVFSTSFSPSPFAPSSSPHTMIPLHKGTATTSANGQPIASPSISPLLHCSLCHNAPASGNLFHCHDCTETAMFAVCQLCFFSSKQIPRSHLSSHAVSIIPETLQR